MSADRSERRVRTLTDEDVRAIALAFEAFRSVPYEEHREHHEFISAWIARQRRKDETVEKVRAQLAGWGIITLLGGIGFAVWEFVKKHLNP